MSSMKLETLIKQFPEESVALSRLQEHLNNWMLSGRYKEFTWERACELTEPQSQNVLLEVLSELCNEGLISYWVRVMSVTGESIKDYPSLGDVPLTLTDWHTGQDVRVEFDKLRVIFKISQQLSQ